MPRNKYPEQTVEKILDAAADSRAKRHHEHAPRPDTCAVGCFAQCRQTGIIPNADG